MVVHASLPLTSNGHPQMTDFLIYDVFTDTRFGGNQLAIIPDARTLPEADLQKIAREFNFSESTFVFPTDGTTDQAKVRIFTPTMEIPFAGHPTIGTPSPCMIWAMTRR